MADTPELERSHAVSGKSTEADRCRRFFEQANAAYAALRADPAEWSEELAERAAWDATLLDGLHDD